MDTQLVSHCPHCRSAVKVRESHFGQPVRCPACREQFAVSSIETPFSAGASLADAPAALETLATNGSAPTDPESLLPPPVLPAPVLRARAQLGRMGRFELSRLLGQGAFGRVYQAYDPQLERYVALKVPTFGPGDKKKIQRFLAEAKAAARLRHPNIVPTYESGQIDGQYYIAAQFVPGQTLSQRLKDAPINFRQAAEWIRQLAEALAYAHFEGIIHRDIKPDNIMIDEKGVPQIMDFGLAKRVNEDAEMTTDGSILGTPAYMAPEQARGNQVQVGPHSDQYSLGVVLYELLTGKRPFAGSPHAVIEQLLGKEPPAPRALRPETPRDLEAICHKAMTKEISGRFASTAELAGDLKCFLCGDATLARPISLIERAARWRRRNPVVAALSGALGLVVLVGLTSNSIALWKVESARQDAVASAEFAKKETIKAQEAEDEAERLRKLAEKHLAEAEAAKQELARKAAAWDELVREHNVLIGDTEKAGEETVELGKTLTRLNAEIAKLNAEIEGQPDRKYRASIQRAFVALSAGDMDTTKRELMDCPPFLQAWEWHLLMAAASLPPKIKVGASGANVFLFSDNGKRLLTGYRGADHKGLRPGWGVIDLEERRATWNDPAFEIEKSSDKVWALSKKTGQEALVVNNNPSTGFAEPFLQSGPTETATEQEVPENGLFNRLVFGGTTLEKFAHRVPGFALDAKQVDGQWLVLTCSIAQWTDGLLPSLSLHTYASPKSKPKTHVIFSPLLHAPDSLDGRVCGASFDESGEQVHLFLQFDGFLRWYGIPLNGEKEVKPKLILEVAGTFGGGREHVLNPRWRPHVCGGRHLVIREMVSGKSQVIFWQEVRKDLSALVGTSPAWFDPQGRRLIVIRDDGELQIIDPIQPTEPLLKIPLVSGSPLPAGSFEAFPILTFSPSGQQLAVAFNGQVFIFDVSDGK